MVDDTLRQRVHRKARTILKRINNAYHSDIVMPRITFDLTGYVAGYAICSTSPYVIRLNVDFLSHYDWHFIDEIVPHEMCHVGAYTIYGHSIKPHGFEWYDMMDEVGMQSVDIYHSFDLRRTKVRYHTKHWYKCMGCGAHTYETQSEHNYIKQRRKHAHCAQCNRRLTYIQELGKISWNRCLQLHGRKSDVPQS